MSITKVHTYTNIGLQGHQITIEVDSNNSLPSIEIIGLPDAAIKESKERIRGAFRNAQVSIPPKKIILNLAPSNIRKVGTRFDLPLAVGILQLVYEQELSEEVRGCFSDSLFFGELGLDGTVKHISGILPSVISAYDQGRRSFFVPYESQHELVCIPGITVYPIQRFSEIVTAIQNNTVPSSVQGTQENWNASVVENSDGFKGIKGHIFVKQALRVAAAGMHNVLLIGPPGSGKTMLSKAVTSSLPPLTFEESIEVSKIYSIVGKLTTQSPMVVTRPCRQIHHTASKVSIVGGGKYLTPGEISLSHRGILFFDELPEFPREVLEVLRQPLEDKMITISRASGSVQYPADFMFIASMNPCKCGFYGDKEKSCSCSLHEIKRYQSKISGPLLDRFDMIIEVHRESFDTIFDQQQESQNSHTSILSAWNIQKQRYAQAPIVLNSQLGAKQIDEYISLNDEICGFMKKSVESLGLSPRVIHKLIKVARTIADLEGSEEIGVNHIAEALQYRSRKMFVL